MGPPGRAPPPPPPPRTLTLPFAASFFPTAPPPPALQERKHFTAYDPRWTAALDMIKEGAFGRADYFEDLVASVTDMNRGNDWFLLGEQRGSAGQRWVARQAR